MLKCIRELGRVLSCEIDPFMCRTFTDQRVGVTYLYVPLATLSEEVAGTLQAKDGFTFACHTHSELWSCVRRGSSSNKPVEKGERRRRRL